MRKILEKNTSFSINLNQKTKNRDRLFYDKYEYSVEFYLPTAIILRGINKGRFTRAYIPKLFTFRANLYNSISTKTYKFLDPDYENPLNIQITEQAFDILSTQQDSLIHTRSKFITVYTNDLSIIDEVRELYERHEHLNLWLIDRPLTLTQCIVDRPRQTIKRRKADHKYRIMFRHKLCSDSMLTGIKTFVETYKDNIAVSSSLHQFLTKTGRTKWYNSAALESHYYVDVNDEKLKVMLDMLAPGATGEVLEIIPYK